MQNQQQRHGIGLGIALGSIDIRNEVPAEDHKARGNEHQNQILHPPNPKEELGKPPCLIRVAVRCNAMNSGRKNGGNRRGEANKQRIDLGAHTIDGHSLRAGYPAKNELVYGPIDLIDDHIQKQEKAESGNFPQTGEIKPIKPEPDTQLFDAVPCAYRKLCNSQYGGNADNCN